MSKKYTEILDDISCAIGNTPIVRLNRLPLEAGIKCEIQAKCEFLNPGGSVKDRIGQAMFLGAEKDGLIKPGDNVIEGTSGNTGVGIALMTAAKGYTCTIVMPEKMSDEKANVLKGLGANIIRTRTSARYFDKDSHISIAKGLGDGENAFCLDQYNNDNNWKAHYEKTGQEIVDCVGGKLDYIFAGVGTGGTITGISKKVKETMPDCKIVGCDPYGSILADPENPDEQLAMPGNLIEGIGYDFVPYNCMRDCVDEWVKTDDAGSYVCARGLMRQEGLLVGGTSGSSLAGCFKYIKENGLEDRSDLRFLVMLPDNIRNYMTKHLSEEWLVKKGFKDAEDFLDTEHPLYGKTAELCNLKAIPHYDDRLTVGDALDCFKKGDKLIPLIESGKVKGILTEDTLLESICKKKLTILSSASNAITAEFVKLPFDTDLSIVYRLLSKNTRVLLERMDGNGERKGIYAITLDEIINIFRNKMKEDLLINF